MNIIKHILAILAIVAATPMLPTVAQNAPTGKWTRFAPHRQQGIRTLAQSPTKLYYLSAMNLYALDKTTLETTWISDLEGVFAMSLAYCPALDVIVVGMLDGYINVVDNSTLNVRKISDLAALNLTYDKHVRSISISGTTAAVATPFGTALVDLAKGKIIDYGVYNPDANDAKKKTGGFWFMAYDGKYLYGVHGSQILRADTSGSSIADASAFNSTYAIPASGSVTYGHNGQIYLAQGTPYGFSKLYRITPNEANFASSTRTEYALAPKSDIMVAGDKVYVVGTPTGGSLSLLDVTGTTPEIVMTLPDEVKDFMSTSISADGSSVWFGTPRGLCAYDPANPSTPIVDYAQSATLKIPSSPVLNANLFRPSLDNRRIWVTTRASGDKRFTGGNRFNPEVKSDLDLWGLSSNAYNAIVYSPSNGNDAYGVAVPSYLAVINDDGSVADRTVYNPLNSNNTRNVADAKEYTKYMVKKFPYFIYSIDGLEENPANPGELWVTAFNEGINKIVDNVDVANLSMRRKTAPNSGSSWNEGIEDIRFDRYGNMWITQNQESNWWNILNPVLQMLPAEYVNGDPSNITNKIQGWGGAEVDGSVWVGAKDFEWASHPNYDFYDERNGKGEGLMTLTRHSPDGKEYIFIVQRAERAPFSIYQRNSTGAGVDADVRFKIDALVNQNGTRFDVGRLLNFSEDLQGRVWIHILGGIFSVDDFSQFNDPNISTLKVTQHLDDETGADIIKGAYGVCVSQGADRTLWVATETDGLYHLNAEGTKVIEVFNSKNSPLKLDAVGAVYAHPTKQEVYVGTPAGLYLFEPDAIPSAPDLSNVTISPSVIERGHTGWVTISNLTDGAMVTIVDSEGNTVHSGAAKGGTHVWDGLATDGATLAPGTYTVKAGPESEQVGRIVVIQ